MAYREAWRVVLHRERRMLLAALGVSLFLAVLAVFAAIYEPGIGGDVVVGEYVVVADLRGPLLLEERIVYRVEGGEYHMLYRSWPWPVGLAGDSGAVLLGVRCPDGLTPYLVDDTGMVTVLSEADPGLAWEIQSRVDEAEAANEAGCYSRTPLAPGSYTVEAYWLLYPPEDYTLEDAVIIPIAVEGEHLDYESIVVEARAGSLAVAPASLAANMTLEERDGWNLYTIGPQSLESQRGLVLAAGPEGSQGVEEFQARARLAETLARGLVVLGAAGAVATPILAAALYHTAGREPPPRGPVPHGYPPSLDEKPWMVNALYEGEPGLAGHEAIAATILDLIGRGVLRVEEAPSGPVLVLPERAEGLDWYEEKVVELLRILSVDGRVELGSVAGTVRERAREIRPLVIELTRGERLRRLAGEAVEAGNKPFAALLVVFMLLAIPVNLAVSELLPLHNNTLALRGLITNLLAAGTNIAVLALPSHVLGRWKPGYLERYAAWQLYREHARKTRPPLDYRALAYLLALGEEKLVRGFLRGDPTPLAKTILRVLRETSTLASTVAATTGGSSGGGGGGGGAGAR